MKDRDKFNLQRSIAINGSEIYFFKNVITYNA